MRRLESRVQPPQSVLPYIQYVIAGKRLKFDVPTVIIIQCCALKGLSSCQPLYDAFGMEIIIAVM